MAETASQEQLVQWAMDTLLIAVTAASTSNATYSARNIFARRELQRIIKSLDANIDQIDNFNRELSKRVLRRATQFINDGLPAGVP